jgi:hypothetical protein
LDPACLNIGIDLNIGLKILNFRQVSHHLIDDVKVDRVDQAHSTGTIISVLFNSGSPVRALALCLKAVASTKQSAYEIEKFARNYFANATVS